MSDNLIGYRLAKLAFHIIFNFNDNNYDSLEEDYMFYLNVLYSLLGIIKKMVEGNYLSQELINNIYNYLYQAREIEDEDRIERINIINEIVQELNKCTCENYLLFYRSELSKRRNNEKYLNKYQNEEIEKEINHANYSISNDIMVLVGLWDETSDSEFLVDYLNDFVNNYYFYESINALLEEQPILFKNLTFYNRMMCVLNANQDIKKNRKIERYHKKLVKRIKNKNL